MPPILRPFQICFLVATLGLIGSIPDLPAGDILRGGASFGTPAARTDQATLATAAAAAAARANARDTLARTTRALVDAQAFQAAARAAAQANTANHLGPNPINPSTNLPVVPNGLGAGGLDRNTAEAWTGADLPTQSVSGGATNVRIRQTQQTALMHWNTFNVGKKTDLYFDQRAGGADVKKWVAFNKVNDPSGVPSQILGSIRADGQVYVINRNGIIFGGASQVNVSSFTASSLPINDNLVSQGLLNNPDAQFLFSGLAIPAGTNGTPAFTPEAPPVATGRYGAVTVQPGARITARTDAAKSGGRVMLVGPTVTNAGTISSPDGQTILAAGLQVGIDSHPTNDPSLRGLDVFVGAIAPSGGTAYAGQVVQSGLIEAERGNITLAGSRIVHTGAMRATTSVSFNGRIDLLAAYDAIPNAAFNPLSASSGRPFLFREAGAVEFGASSLTAVLPELGSTESVVGTRLSQNSQINATGKTIYHAPFSSVVAPSGDITLRAGRFNFIGGSNPRSFFIRSGGQIFLDRGASITAAGATTARIPISQNILEVELRGSEFSRSPLQREGVLRGAPITLDTRRSGTYNGFQWVGTPLGDATGFVGLILRDVAEFSARGGSVTLSAGESVALQPGSVIDASGGYVEYEGGMIRTTRLLSRGQLFRIEDATPNRVYDGIYHGTTTTTSPRWGVTRTYSQPLALLGEHYEPSYVEGRSGGRLSIEAPSMALGGSLRGNTVPEQRQVGDPVDPASLKLAFIADDPSLVAVPTFSPTPPTVVFAASTPLSVPNFRTDSAGDPIPLPLARRSNVMLSPDLLSSSGGGFGSLSVFNPDGAILLPGESSLVTQAKGGVELVGTNLDIGGDIVSPGGTISLTARNLSLSQVNLAIFTTRTNPNARIGHGNLNLRSGSMLSTAGTIADRRPSSSIPIRPVANDGGDIRLSGYNVRLARGSTLDVSGGLVAELDGVRYGDAGLIHVEGGRDVELTSVIGGKLDLGTNMIGYGGAHGGTLELVAPAFRIGGTRTHPSSVYLSPSFFGSGGFEAVSLDSFGVLPDGPVTRDANGVEQFVTGIDLAPGVRINGRVLGRTVPLLPTRSVADSLRILLQPEGIRPPARLSFKGSGTSNPFVDGLLISRSDVRIGEGSSVTTDALGSITLSGQTVTLLGSLTAPGGDISVNAGSSVPLSTGAAVDNAATVYIGPRAKLDAAGKAVSRPGFRGGREGFVTPGGSIEITGNIVASEGSVAIVSGTSGVLDLPAPFSGTGRRQLGGFGGAAFTPVRFDTNGGSITLQGNNLLYADTRLIGERGGPAAIGGTLSVSSGRIPTTVAFSTADIDLIVQGEGQTLAETSGPVGIGIPLKDSTGVALPAIGRFSTANAASGGFDTVRLGGNVRFSGDVSLSTPGQLHVASGGVLESLGNTVLASSYVKLGQAFTPPRLDTEPEIPFTGTDQNGVTGPVDVAPTGGIGSLTVRAKLIDVGNLVLRQIGSAHLSAAAGDLRGNGTLTAAGSLILEAGQIYPTTANTFHVFVYPTTPGGSSSLSILPGRSRPLPLSGGGELGLFASTITQAGTIRAPMGQIRLGWDGTGTAPDNAITGTALSVPVTQSLRLASGSVTSVSGIDPRTGRGLIIPYGTSPDGVTWLDPAGNDISVNGPPAKGVTLSSRALSTDAGSVIDVRGGGDLFAYRWIEGNTGPEDILNTNASFAILPGYGFNYSPYGESRVTTGYYNSSLQPGDQVTLSGIPGLARGTYTLLPARYALLPGGHLITPQSEPPAGSAAVADGSAVVSGYRANNLDSRRVGRTNVERFEVLSGTAIRDRAAYDELFITPFVREAARQRSAAAPRLPADSGYVGFLATTEMNLAGSVLGASNSDGRGALIDISSPSDIVINATGTSPTPGVLAIRAALLSTFQAESLLIGGQRTLSGSSTVVNVATRSILVDNSDAPLQGSDIILAASREITLAPGAQIRGIGSALTDALALGTQGVSGSGDGVLVRVSGSDSALVSRQGVSPSSTPLLAIGADAVLAGGSVVLDSSSRTSLDPSAQLSASSVSLRSGRVSLQLDPAVTLNPTTGLVLRRSALDALGASAKRVALLSYGAIDVYGAGVVGSRDLEDLSLQANAIRGFGTGTGEAKFVARTLSIGNSAGASISPLSTLPQNGTLALEADQILVGPNALRTERFANTRMTATSRIVGSGTGSYSTTGTLALDTPLLTATANAEVTFRATGQLRHVNSGGTSAGSSAGLGGQLSLIGGGVSLDSTVLLPSGRLAVTATSGNLVVGATSPARLDVGGSSQRFLDVIRHAAAGSILLESTTGNVELETGSTVQVAADSLGGHAGSLAVRSPLGTFALRGTVSGGAASGFRTGSFSLDTATVPSGDLAATDSILNGGNFRESRDYRIRTGNLSLSGQAQSSTYRVAVDQGSLTVLSSTKIDASGTTGGAIELASHGNLVLSSGALLDASAAQFDAAGKGGSVFLSAGTSRSGAVGPGTLTLQTGATIDLSVDAATPASPGRGQFTGTLHLRAPQNGGSTDIGIAQIGSTVTNASSVLVEGYRLYDRTGTGTLSTALRDSLQTDGNLLFAHETAILNRLNGAAGNPMNLILAPGAEILNTSGDLTLGSASSTSSQDWNLAGFRFGSRSAPGVLTLRASGSLNLFNAISDGFSGGTSLWLAPLMANNAALPDNAETWSYHFTAGADLGAASHRATRSPSEPGFTSGSLRLGKDLGAAEVGAGGATVETRALVEDSFSVIRTGSGNIDINAAENVELRNVFASIYTAGTQVASPTTVVTAGDFSVPVQFSRVNQGNLGIIQQAYGAYYSLAGGNLNIAAGVNLERKTSNGTSLIDDSSRQLPNNWLYRRGHLGTDGSFGPVLIGSGGQIVDDPAASTSWWIDFSNFFQTSGALGGGNVTLTAGQDVKNFDAVIPTNARAARGVPSANSFLELGGGNLTVVAGNDINGGIYYVERGSGRLAAGRAVTTNSTRSPSLGILGSLGTPDNFRLDSNAWLPTTLFLGKSSFQVSARKDVLLGPAANPFLLPQGQNNGYWYKTYFSTLAPDSGVEAFSLSGDVHLRNAATRPDSSSPQDLLFLWLTSQNFFRDAGLASWKQPWLRLAEDSLQPFTTLSTLRAPNLTATALSGDINLAGSFTLSPSSSGQLELVAGNGAINALRPTGVTSIVTGQNTFIWSAATINVSDASPSAVPGALTPSSHYSFIGRSTSPNNNSRSLDDTGRSFSQVLNGLFTESGSTAGSFATTQTKLGLHDPNLLHRNDPSPLRLYALGGDISGLTLFSPKPSRLYASRDVTDLSFYGQNLASDQLTVISAGRDIVPYNAASPLRVAAFTPGNLVSPSQSPLAGDLHLGGPGAFQILAGRDLNLGVGLTNADGTGSGILTLGNIRNLALPFAGADLQVAAGIGPASSLRGSQLNVAEFTARYVTSRAGARYLRELGIADFGALDPESQAQVALDVFYLILRDTGRNFNNPRSPGYKSYATGFAAIDTLFGLQSYDGDILAQGRSIRTRTGGDISLFAPGGGLSLADSLLGSPLVPPGIVTETGGRVSIFTHDSVDIGVGRIFTLRGGDMMIWSSAGDIAAGAASKTVQSAPPTRVVFDPQSAAVETDLAGLATGGGIGVLATVAGVKPGNVDLIAPTGVIDAGDAGIRVTGNINLAATQVLNASNIAVGGSSSGAPAAPVVSAPNIGGLTSASNASAAGSTAATAATEASRQQAAQGPTSETAPSVYTVEVLGYGGGAAPEEEEEEPGT